MLGLVAYRAGLCACGWHESLATDKSNHFTFEDKFCPVCAGVAQYDRITRDRDETMVKRLGEKPPPSAKRPSDGRRTFTRMMSPDEVAAKANPGRP